VFVLLVAVTVHQAVELYLALTSGKVHHKAPFWFALVIVLVFDGIVVRFTIRAGVRLRTKRRERNASDVPG
jgi:hypothetical protein